MGKANEPKQSLKNLFTRIAIALDIGEVPTVEDAVTFEQLIICYWEKEQELSELGLVSRVVNRATDITKLNKDSIQSIANHFVHQKLPENVEVFAGLLHYYLDGRITASDLLGERARKPRNGCSWQDYDQLGEKAEYIHHQFTDKNDKPILQTGNRSISNGLNVNLYNLLSDLSVPNADVEKVRIKYKLPLNIQLSLIISGFLSPSQWRDCHQEFKNHF